MSDKKKEQLGMNPSTASHRLVKDVMWSLIVKTGQNICYHCGLEMSREDFSIEHKTPWLDSDDPIGLYFDLDNISFSHLSCNARAAKRAWTKHPTKDAAKLAHLETAREWKRQNRTYDPIERRERYQRIGS